jgi:hypothetical protein
MTKAEIVPLEKMTKAQLADEFGPAKARFKKLEERFEALKGEFARRGLKAAEGSKFVVTVSESTFDGVDIKAARAALGEAWCKKHVNPVTRTYYNVHPVAAPKKSAKR